MPPKRKATSKAAPKSPVKVPATVDVDWESMTVVQLKEELESRNLDVKGKKDVLIKRLQDDDDGNSANMVDGGAGDVKFSPKKAKTDAEPPKTVTQQVIEKLTAGSSSGPKLFKIDSLVFQLAPSEYKQVHGDYSFMLNQTNIGNNNNKYYVGQLLERNDGKYDVFTKWGRVGDPGQNQIAGPTELEDAIKTFEQKFTSKTGNNWDNRADFKPKSGKYTLIETEGDDEEETVQVDTTEKVVGSLSAKSNLDADTQQLVSLIFDHDMFNNAMQKLDLDTKKMPLGKLSKAQIAKGFQALEKIENAIKTSTQGAAKKVEELQLLSNEFYTVIPHNFKRTRPPVIDDLAIVQAKFDMLITLGDIEIAQEMQKLQEKNASVAQHPCDIKYGHLKCGLSLVDPSSHEYQVLEKYFASTKGQGSNLQLRHIWRVDRESDDLRFKSHDSIGHRKLLWHGTNVAVVAAILKTGLRIMPHSGGRVGKGIYFASENGKSAGYTQPAKGTGLMFLNEVALGKEHGITTDDSRITAAPAGFDSVVARGQQEPDPAADAELRLGGKKVIVPQGPPIPQSKYSKSTFHQSEYLVYKESQVRIRYLLSLDWGYGY